MFDFGLYLQQILKFIKNENLCRAGYATLMGAYLEWHPK